MFHDTEFFQLKNKKKNYCQIKDVVEKPSINKSPSNYAIIGRYILPRKILFKLKNLKPGQGGEVHITLSGSTIFSSTEFEFEDSKVYVFRQDHDSNIGNQIVFGSTNNDQTTILTTDNGATVVGTACYPGAYTTLQNVKN